VDSTELRLVSESLQVGGTLDAGGRGKVSSRRALIDWKTSNRVYADYLVQCGGYSALWNEAFPDDPIQEIHLLRVGKRYAEFEHRVWGEDVVALAMDQFKVLREAFDLDLQLRQLV